MKTNLSMQILFFYTSKIQDFTPANLQQLDLMEVAESLDQPHVACLVAVLCQHTQLGLAPGEGGRD